MLNLPSELSPLTSITRGHDRRYLIPFSRINVHKFSFFPATIRFWNCLPYQIVNLETIGRFRNSVNDYVINN